MAYIYDSILDRGRMRKKGGLGWIELEIYATRVLGFLKIPKKALLKSM